MFKMLQKMCRRGCPAKMRVPTELSAPIEEHIDESVNFPIPPPVPLEPSQAGPSHPLEPAGVNIPFNQMAQILATAFRQPREPTVSIERARKLDARNYDGIGDPEKAWSWLEGNERVFNVMGCSDENIVTDYEKKFSELVRHVPLFCDHEVQKSKRFVMGLRKEVKRILVSVSHTHYGQVVEAAIRIERSLRLAPHISQGTQGPKRDGSTWTQGESSKKVKEGRKPP